MTAVLGQLTTAYLIVTIVIDLIINVVNVRIALQTKYIHTYV